MKGKKIVALGLCVAMLLSNGAVAQAAQAEARASATLGDKVTVGETEFSYLLIISKTFFEITESWKSNISDEPSELYIFSTRFGGCIYTVLGILSIIFL